ncbi:MAG: hypothetical protein GX755_00285 [Syntrophomonadaceae bacterium]|nr:hypothetical protein [Syntrophomonadaceae bacterium]
MNPTVIEALNVAAIGLPAMFGVIILFVALGQALLKLFPEKSNSAK